MTRPLNSRLPVLSVSAALTALALVSAGAVYFSLPPTAPSATPVSDIPPDDAGAPTASVPERFTTLWWTDFNNNRVVGFDAEGRTVWAQNMANVPLPSSSWYFIGGIEYITLAPNGNLMTSHGDGMMVQEIDRATHTLVWQYGTAGLQTYRGGVLDEPDKAYKLNDHEVLINSGNDRMVIIVDQRTNDVVWSYGQYHTMGTTPGLLQGNTAAVPLNNGTEFVITDTLAKKILIIDRATKNIVWEWRKEDAKWLQHVFPTHDGTFVMEDRQKGEVFEVNRVGDIVWMLSRFSDGAKIMYPTDTAKLGNGHILVAEAGRRRIVEVVPQTGEVVRVYPVDGFVSSIARDFAPVDESEVNGVAHVREAESKVAGHHARRGVPITVEGRVDTVNASTAHAGQFTITTPRGGIAVGSYNDTTIVRRGGGRFALDALRKGDRVRVTGMQQGDVISATRIEAMSR